MVNSPISCESYSRTDVISALNEQSAILGNEMKENGLEVVNSVKNLKAEESKNEDDREPRIRFECSECGMNEMVHDFGTAPKFSVGVDFMEDTYIMIDPFQPPMPRGKGKPEYFVAIGSHCNRCNRLVCKDTDCSFFYTKTFCFSCAEKILKSFPVEAQLRFRKQSAAKKKN